MITRRDFLIGSSATIVSQMNPFYTFMPVMLAGRPKRVGITSDLQLGQIFPAQINRQVEFWLVPGDVTYIDFSDRQEAELRWAAALTELNKLGTPYYMVPGNHDWAMPSTGLPLPPPTSLAVELWSTYVGNTQFVVDIDNIRFIGVDYYDWSVDNQLWLGQQLQTTKRKVVLSHYPLMGCQQFYDRSPGVWWDQHYQSKLQFMLQNNVDLFVSGHRHQFSIAKYGNMTHVICPALFSVVDDNTPEVIPNSNIMPFTIPTRGWLELTNFRVELYRADGGFLYSYNW